MKKLYITSPIPLVDLEKATITNVIDVDFTTLSSLWSRFLKDLNTIAQSIREALEKRNSPCISRPECRVRLLTDAIVSFIKHLTVVLLVPPPATGKAPAPLYLQDVFPPQDLFLLYSILKGYCKYASVDQDICALFTALEVLIVGDRVADLPESIKEVWRAVKGLVNIIGVNAFNLIFDSYSALEEDHTRVCRDGNVYRLGLVRCIPADTRPGLNSSSLLVHTLLTSALARLIFEHRSQRLNVANKDLAIEIVRLASILHDIGKPIAWHETFARGTPVSHVSDEILDRVWQTLKDFENLLGSDVWMYIRMLVKCHHSKDSRKCVEDEILKLSSSTRYWPVDVLVAMAESIALADKVSSAIDRVKQIVIARSSEIERLANVKWQEIAPLFEDDERSWLWQIRAEDSLVERIAKAIAQSILSESAVAEVGGEVVEGVTIGVADIREIQKFISREDLRTLIGGSMAVDIVTLGIIPALVLKVLDLNIEHILYSGGGVVNFLMKGGSDVVKVLSKAYAEIASKARWLPEVVFAESELLSDWRATTRKLFTRLAIAKMLPQPVQVSAIHLTDLGVGVVCELCGRRAATIVEQGFAACSACYSLRALGDSFYIKTKLSLLEKAGYSIGGGEEAIMQHLMEWLSGSPGWSRGEGFNIAVLYADMNLGGLFFANSLSMSEAFTKSVLVDYALKKALYTALKVVKQVYGGRGNDILARCYTGILYAGGDDLLAIVPSSVAPLLALYIATVFWSIVGSRQLSIAIASAKPKQNVWNVIDTAKRLLDEAKDFIRREVKGFEDLKTVVGVVTIIYSDKQLLPAYISTLETYKSMGLSSQPLVIRVELGDGFKFVNGFNSFTTMLNLFTVGEVGKFTSVRDLVASATQGKALCLQASADVEDFVREVYHIAKKHSASAEELHLKAAVYAVNYYIRVKGSEFGNKLKGFLEPVINDMSRLTHGSSGKSRGFFPLYDLYLIQKVLEGLRCF